MVREGGPNVYHVLVSIWCLRSQGEGWSGECGRSVPSRQIVKPARRRRTRVAEKNVLGACPFVHVGVCAE